MQLVNKLYQRVIYLDQYTTWKKKNILWRKTWGLSKNAGWQREIREMHNPRKSIILEDNLLVGTKSSLWLYHTGKQEIQTEKFYSNSTASSLLLEAQARALCTTEWWGNSSQGRQGDNDVSCFGLLWTVPSYVDGTVCSVMAEGFMEHLTHQVNTTEGRLEMCWTKQNTSSARGLLTFEVSLFEFFLLYW